MKADDEDAVVLWQVMKPIPVKWVREDSAVEGNRGVDRWVKADDEDAVEVIRWVKGDRVEDLQVVRDKDAGAVRWDRVDNEVAMGREDRDADKWDRADRAEVLQVGKAAVISQTA